MPRPPYPYRTWAAYQQAHGERATALRGPRRGRLSRDNAEAWRRAIWQPLRRAFWTWADARTGAAKVVDAYEIEAHRRRGEDPVRSVLEGPFWADNLAAVMMTYEQLAAFAQGGPWSPVSLDTVVGNTRADTLTYMGFPMEVDIPALRTLALYEAWMRLGPAALPREAPGVQWWLAILAQEPDAGEGYWAEMPAYPDEYSDERVSADDAWQIVDPTGQLWRRRPPASLARRLRG
jgi:hypothetical protein